MLDLPHVEPLLVSASCSTPENEAPQRLRFESDGTSLSSLSDLTPVLLPNVNAGMRWPRCAYFGTVVVLAILAAVLQHAAAPSLQRGRASGCGGATVGRLSLLWFDCDAK